MARTRLEKISRIVSLPTGQYPNWRWLFGISALERITDPVRTSREVRLVPILLQKSVEVGVER